MKKNQLCFLFLLVLLVFTGCMHQKGEQGDKGITKNGSEATTAPMLRTLEDIKDKRIGVLLGSIHDAYATKNFPAAKILQYQNFSDLVIAVNTDKIDAAFFSQNFLPEVIAANPQVGILVDSLWSVKLGAGFNKENSKLREQFNTFLREIKSNGIYADMVTRWIKNRATDMPEIKTGTTNGEIKVGTVSDLGIPFAFIKDGKLMGFDVELSSRFAAYLGKKLVSTDMPFGSLLAAVSTNKIDLINSSLAITEERKKQIDFSDSYYYSNVSIIANKKNLVSKSSGKMKTEVIAAKKNLTGNKEEPVYPVKISFIKSLANSFYNNIILEHRYLMILDGLKVTVLISILSALFGTLIGALICFMRMSKRKILSVTARLYISLIRGTPVLVLLMIIFYVIFASVNINPTLVAVVAFGLNFGAYVSEMFRSSIQSIDKGQHEAGIASGFSEVQTFIYITMPQAIRQVLPVYKGEFISLLKMTSVVGYIAVQDLTKASDIIRSRTFDAFFPLIMAAVLYIIIAGLLTLSLSYVETKVDPKRKRTIKKLEVKL